jgi:hypothetical protein
MRKYRQLQDAGVRVLPVPLSYGSTWHGESNAFVPSMRTNPIPIRPSLARPWVPKPSTVLTALLSSAPSRMIALYSVDSVLERVRGLGGYLCR